VQFAQVIGGVEYGLSLSSCKNNDPEINYFGKIFHTADNTGLGTARDQPCNVYTFFLIQGYHKIMVGFKASTEENLVREKYLQRALGGDTWCVKKLFQ
jgi:hypothetical protein